VTCAFYTRLLQNACNLKPSDLHWFCSGRRQMALGDQISSYELLSKMLVAMVWCRPDGEYNSPVVCGSMIAPGARMFVSWERRVLSGCLYDGQMPRPGIATECVWVHVWTGETVYLYTYRDHVQWVGLKRNLLR